MTGLLSACTAMSPTADMPGLDGTAWVLSALPGRTLVTEVNATLHFDTGRAVGTDGCNRYAVPYSVTGSSVRFEAAGVSTQMACPPDVMQQASAFMSSLTDARRYRLVGGELQLLAADGTPLAILAPQPQELAGTSWRVDSYNNGAQAVVSVLNDTTLTLAFSGDGKASGSAGCNSYFGAYALSGSTLKFGPLATTRKMCAEPQRVMEQEQQFLKALGTVATAKQEGDRLELRTADGALALSLARQAVQ